MKITSFDIGSTNLAYLIIDCPVINKKLDINSIKIIDFALIDLNNIEHSKTINNIDQMICNQICKSGKRCTIKSKSGYNKCTRHLNNVVTKKKKTSRYLNKKKICQNMIRFLNSCKELTDVDVVLIEQQPPKSNKMREISHYLFMYLMGRIENNLLMRKTNLMYLTARRRMESLCRIYNDCNLDYKSNNIKYNRKQNAVKLTRWIINNYFHNTKLLDFFNNLQKKDDLSDCLVQILWYLHKNKIQLR